jgi:hypothetical protein
MRTTSLKMSLPLLVALVALTSLPALAQDQATCKGYFQVLRAGKDMPGLVSGLDAAQKKWWGSHQKKYPGLCLSGSVATGDKPRYLVIWSKSLTVGQTSQGPSDIYGQMAATLAATTPTTKIYQKRWDLAAVTVINVEADGGMLLPPVHFEADDRWTGALTGAGPIHSFHPGSAKVLQAAVDYLYQERVFLAHPD